MSGPANPSGSLCGLWIDHDGRAHLALAQADGTRTETTADFKPFAWLTAAAGEISLVGINVENLPGSGAFNRLAHADNSAAFAGLQALVPRQALDVLRPDASQYLLQNQARLYAGLNFNQLRRCQLDIETGSGDGGFSDATQPADRVLAIGLRFGPRERLLVLEELTNAAEKNSLRNSMQFCGRRIPISSRATISSNSTSITCGCVASGTRCPVPGAALGSARSFATAASRWPSAGLIFRAVTYLGGR
jgi:hypothetical protein